MLGTYVLSAGYYDAYYLRAQRVRTLLRRDFEAAFREVDVIAAPVTPTVAFKLGEKVDDPLGDVDAGVISIRCRRASCGPAGDKRPLRAGERFAGRAPAHRKAARRAGALRARPRVGADLARARSPRPGLVVTIVVEASAAEHASALAELFTRAGSNALLLPLLAFSKAPTTSGSIACANDRDRNRDELIDACRSESDEARGMVALAGGAIVGWMKVAARGLDDQGLRATPLQASALASTAIAAGPHASAAS